MSPARARRAGFTLIEVVAAFFMTVVILAFVTSMFVENGRQREAATSLMRERLSGTAALDLIGADFAGALFVTEGAEEDVAAPSAWHFIGASPGEHGSTEVRFVTQSGPRANPAAGSSGWIEVAYFLAPEDDDGEMVLWRWSSPRPPTEAPRGFPQPDTPGSARVAVGVTAFGVRWLDGEGAWQDEWDSSFTTPEQAMPEAVEISLQMMKTVRPGTVDGDPDATEMPGRLVSRRVALAMRPLDVQTLIELASGGEEEASCPTVEDCVSQGDATWYQSLLADSCGGDDKLCAALRDSSKTCWSTIQTTYPAIAARAPEGCGS